MRLNASIRDTESLADFIEWLERARQAFMCNDRDGFDKWGMIVSYKDGEMMCIRRVKILQ